jgi:uncharacterized protein (UPF0335 family)
MSEPAIGHNSTAAGDQLKSITDRINRLEDEKKDISNSINDLYAEAKSNGYNPKALRVVVRRQRADAQKQAELDADTDAYMAALGMV